MKSVRTSEWVPDMYGTRIRFNKKKIFEIGKKNDWVMNDKSCDNDLGDVR